MMPRQGRHSPPQLPNRARRRAVRAGGRSGPPHPGRVTVGSSGRSRPPRSFSTRTHSSTRERGNGGCDTPTEARAGAPEGLRGVGGGLSVWEGLVGWLGGGRTSHL